MNKFSFAIAAGAVLLLSGFTAYNAISWKIADGYSIKFTSANPSGVFTKLNGVIVFDENSPETSNFNMTVEVASINTGNGMKNKHAKGENWFDSAKFPLIKFASDKISKTDKGYDVTGTLDMHGIQKKITFPFTFSNNIFSGSFNINRLDYKIGTTEGMSDNAATNIKVDISVPVTK